MAKEDVLGQLDDIVSELEDEFTKFYSLGRLDQVRSTVATVKMAVEHLYDEAEREEHEDRKDGVIQQMVLSGRNMSEAKEAVERGER